MTDQFELQRFVDAQAPLYAQVMSELRDGRKRSHWMWFIFLQIAGLGRRATAHRYAVASRDEAVRLRCSLVAPLFGDGWREFAQSVISL
jgi:uncharacterized protein (DUF1810 family)